MPVCRLARPALTHAASFGAFFGMIVILPLWYGQTRGHAAARGTRPG